MVRLIILNFALEKTIFPGFEPKRSAPRADMTFTVPAGKQFVSEGSTIAVGNNTLMYSAGRPDSLFEEPHKSSHFPGESVRIPEMGKGTAPTVCHRPPVRIGQIQDPVGVTKSPVSDEAIPTN